VQNIYDKNDGFRQFTIQEANAILPQVIDITEIAINKLDRLKKELESDSAQADNADENARFERESIEILQSWAHAIVTLGAYPKGYFTVDFKSPVPDTLFCWTYGESGIGHTHKIYETFKERIPIEDVDAIGFENSRN
jgi:hypothetical protein